MHVAKETPPCYPLLSFSSCLSDCLWKEVTLGICYCIGDDLSQLFIYIYFIQFQMSPFFFFFFFRLWQGVRSSQGKEFKKEINATIDTSYVSGEEECEFVVYKQSFSTSNMRGFLDIMTLLILCCCANPTQCMYNVRSNRKNVLFDSSLCLKHTVMLIPSCWSVTM